MNAQGPYRLISAFSVFFLVFSSLFSISPPKAVLADHTLDPGSVTVAGSLDSEIGCSDDWQPDCAAAHLTYDPVDEAWQGSFSLPAGNYEYKAALNNSWDENYGLNAGPGGANIPLAVAAPSTVKFYYSHHTHWITSNLNARIVTAPGSYQSELGCPGDWQPDCLLSWLQDPDGDGTYSFSTSSIPAGNYEFKAAINEAWDENYGAGGAPGGANIPFTVPSGTANVKFTFVSSTNTITVTVTGLGPQPDNNVMWDGLRHDSRDSLYRAPGGAVPAGQAVKLRFRTFHNDVTAVKARVYSLNAGAQQILPMHVTASDVSCYQEGLPYSCDFWEVTLPNPAPDNLWYRFIVEDGSKTVYYADNTGALDGGLGLPSDAAVDNSYALMVYDPGFLVPDWAHKAVIYQIFPDRFRDGRSDNNPHTGDVRYDDPVLSLPWRTLPEGYCRNYADAATNCPWRFDTTPPDSSPTKEQPRGRDYLGGDLKGVDQSLDYLARLGVNTIYFNPIFDSGSNHGYDTQDYYKIDPYFGTQKDWDNLAKHAKQLGIRIILDGVYNHLSSDSPFFDRYGHYTAVGACESTASPYRAWFTFHDVTPGTGSCVSSTGIASAATYDGWFGFDSIPVINNSLPDVQEYFLTGSNSVGRYWLKKGASGWRMDVMGDSSFPPGYWETFRGVVKGTDPKAVIVSETWQKDSTLLRMLRGDRADTTMNYRLRDAVIGFLAPGNFDSKGFADSGRIILPSEFSARLQSIQEDYPAGAFYSAMNLLDSHDTERLLWTLTPGSETTVDKQANINQGKASQRLASLMQFTLPGAPTVFYGDEVALTGDDDPDDRRTYPWADKGGSPDLSMFAHYQKLAQIRRSSTALTDGDLRMLLADDAAGTVAYGRKSNSLAALVIINRSDQPRTVEVPVTGYLPDNTQLSSLYGVANAGALNLMVTGGKITVNLAPHSGWLLGTGAVDLQPTAAPANLRMTSQGSMQVSLAWDAVPGAAGYNLYRSPVSGGGWVKVNVQPLTGLTYTDTGLRNGAPYYYVVTALDGPGNESPSSNEASGLPALQIGWANLQWPPTLTHTISATDRTDDVYGRIWIDGVTNQAGASPGLRAQAGFGPVGSNPASDAGWTWVEASFNTDVDNNDEFKASFLPQSVGSFDYVYRYSTTNGLTWLYADLNGPISAGALPPNPGKLTVNSTGDTTPPSAPTGLIVTSTSPASISLGWDVHPNGAGDLSGFAVYRDEQQIAILLGAGLHAYTDMTVTEGATYTYTLKAFDNSLNFSDPSDPVTATAAPRLVTLVFVVTVPATTDGTGRTVNIAGFLDRLQGGWPQWDPGGAPLTHVDATHWTITFTGYEGVQLEYKYTLGDWDHVEKGAACDEIGNRQLTLSYGSTGTMTIDDTVMNWRNVLPCGN